MSLLDDPTLGDGLSNNRFRCLIALLVGLLPLRAAMADCLLGGQAAPFSDASYCCSRQLQSNGLGICTDVPSCLAGGAPADLNHPGNCCSGSALVNGGNPICGAASPTCFAGGHPADLNYPGQCCSQSALINGGNPVCQAQTSNAYGVGTAFIDLNNSKQQDSSEKGSNLADAALSVYAVDSTSHVVGRTFVAQDGYWRIESGLQANQVYTFVLSKLANLSTGTLSPPPILPSGVFTTGENRSLAYQSAGSIDGTSDGRVQEFSTSGSATSPVEYINFGLTDRIFSGTFD